MKTLIGALFIISGTSFCGFAAVKSLSRHTRVLSALVSALGVLESEIEFCLSPLPVVMGRLAVQYPMLEPLFGPCSRDITSESRFGEHWETALQGAAPFRTPALPLKPDECQTLLELGAVLGRYDPESQRKALCQARLRLADMQRRAQEEQAVKSKLYGFMGVAAGLMLTILFV